jgi:outer membrane protein OmpA-like peptidoglycan-associated protein
VPDPGHKKARVVIARHDRRRDDPHPDPQSPRLTGRYESLTFDLTVQINQAGTHVHCFVAPVMRGRVVLDGKPVPHRLLFQLGGDRQGDGSYALYAYPDPDATRGTLRVLGEGQLQLRLVERYGDDVLDQSFVLRRLTRESTLSPRALSRLPAGSELVRATQWYPLTTDRLLALRAGLSLAALSGPLTAFFDAGSSIRMADQLDRHRIARQIDDHLGRVFSTDPPQGLHPDDLLLARFYGRRMLAAQRWTYESSNRSLLDWLEVVFDVVAAFPRAVRGEPLAHFRDDLGLRADRDGGDASAPQQHYEVELVVAGLAGDVGLGLSGFSGDLNIKKTTPPTWEAKYRIVLGGISAGPGVGVHAGFRTSGSADTYSQWLPGDVPGWFNILDASVAVTPGAGASYGATVLSIEGKGIHPPMTVDLSGLTKTIGLGAGASYGGSWGYAFDDSQRFKEQKIDHVLPEEHDYTVEAHLADKLHFLLGSAILTPDARRTLRIFCAMELASLQSSGGRLVVLGHADRLDTVKRNQELSENRAFNALLAVKDIVGDQLEVRDDHQVSLGLGETGAAMALEKDESPDPAWRRVDIILDSQRVVSLHGE